MLREHFNDCVVVASYILHFSLAEMLKTFCQAQLQFLEQKTEHCYEATLKHGRTDLRRYGNSH